MLFLGLALVNVLHVVILYLMHTVLLCSGNFYCVYSLHLENAFLDSLSLASAPLILFLCNTGEGVCVCVCQ